jgi:hypothetical protein
MRNASKVSDIEHALVRLSIISDNAASIDSERHREVLDAHIVNDLIVCALQKRRVDRDNRFHPFACQASRVRNGVLLADANVIHLSRNYLLHFIESCAAWHRGGNRHN